MDNTRSSLDDLQHSRLGLLGSGFLLLNRVYSPYGYSARKGGVSPILGFNGERRDPVSQGYLLGNGYRNFNPILMRFISPDSLSPFGVGGVNTYCFCAGDPVNRQDPSGHAGWPVFPESFRFGKYRRAVMSSYQEVGRSRVRRTSMPALVSRPSENEILNKWDMIGYHAGKAKNKKGLQAALDPIFQGSPGREDFGPGFYSAPELDIPIEVGEAIQRIDKEQPTMFSLYVENMARLKPGRDFEFSQLPERFTHRKELEMVFRTAAYEMIAVRVTRGPAKIVLPRSKEAPF